MVQIQILNGAKAGTRWVAGPLPFSVGRSAEDSLRLDDAGVWEHHCRVELREDHRAALVAAPDALTAVNGQPTQDIVLRNGDIIELGSLRLQFGFTPTSHRSLRLREITTWVAFALLALTQVALIYLLSVDL